MDIKELVLKMPKTESDRNNGINDGNIETYKNEPMLSLTKEELQNSTDGAQRIDGISKKVIVEFEPFDLYSRDFPALEETLNVFNNEKSYWDNYLQEDKKAVRFFEDALRVLKEEKIRCLRISDYNTTGLTGINSESSSPWNNLVKNRGVSDKPGFSGGSFGIGKDAAFACSKPRIVFYGTKNIDNEEAFQGVIKLPSYKYDGKNFEGFGDYLVKTESGELSTCLECLSLDKNHVRTIPGMDKYIIGFDGSITDENLQRSLITSSINNFLYAFFTDKLEIKCGDITVNQSNLDNIIEKYQDEGIDQLTKEYFATLKIPDKVESVSVISDNDVKLYVKMNPDASRKAAIVRQSGMKVFDQNRIDRRVGFSAVIVLEGDEVNQYFKKLENAEHNKWANGREEDKKTTKQYKDKIFNTLKQIISELHQEDYEASMDADGLNEYLPFSYVTGKRNNTDTLSNEVEETKKAIKKKKNKVQQKTETEETFLYDKDENGNIIEGSIHIGTKDIDGKNPNPYNPEHPDIDTDGNTTVSPSEEDGFISKKQISSSALSFFLLEQNNIYTLRFKSEKAINHGFIKVSISGEQENKSVEIKSAKLNGVDAKFSGDKISVSNIKENERNEIIFSISEEGNWALEVLAYEN